MNFKIALTVSLATIGLSSAVQAASFTLDSPTSAGTLPSGVSPIGGIVSDFVGLNGNRVVSQLSADSLFSGFVGATENPLEIGTQSGFSSSVTGALGGGIAEASFRITLFDGDTAPGNFDFNFNTLLVNGLNFGNFSDVQTVETDAVGNVLSGPDAGFENNDLDTGFFSSNDSVLLSNLFSSLTATETLAFELDDVDPGDQFFDFTQGIDASLIEIGSGPVVTPGTPADAIPEPTTVLGSLFAAAVGGRFIKRKKAA